MLQGKWLDKTLLTTAVLGSLILLNVVSTRFFGRVDLTREKQFTLSSATRQALANLHEPLTLRGYFTQDLPPPHATQARYVRDLLEEYYTYGKGQVRFEFIDPIASESSDEKEKKKDIKQDMFGRQVRESTAIERELQQLGIPAVQVRVNQDDKLEVKRAYMGIAVHYGDKHDVIPVVSETQGLEYELTTLIRKVTQDKHITLGWLTGHEGLSLDHDLSRAHDALRSLFEVLEVNLDSGDIPAQINALLVVAPKTPLSEREKRRLDSFITQGHAAAFFLPPITPNLSSLEQETNDPQLQALLAHYGVNVHAGLVLDAECATINVSQQQGFMRFSQPVRYPFIPLPKNLENNNLTRGLAQVAFPFMAPVEAISPLPAGITAQTLVQSSAKSWVQAAPYDLNPTQEWLLPAEASQVHAQSMVVSLEGTFKPFYAAEAAAPNASGTAATPAAAGLPTRLLVAGGAAFVQDAFFGKPHETLLLNLVDWLVHEDALLAVRSRGLATAPLRELTESGRATVKYSNIIGLPVVLIGLGLLRWRRREARRLQVAF